MSVGHSTGTFNSALYLDRVDEAAALCGRPKRPYRGVDALALRRIQQCEKLQRQFARVIRVESRKDENWVPDLDFVKAFDAVGEALVRTWESIRKARKEEAEARKGMTDEQLEQQTIAQMLVAARRMAPDQVNALLTQWFGKVAADKLMPLVGLAQGDGNGSGGLP